MSGAPLQIDHKGLPELSAKFQRMLQNADNLEPAMDEIGFGLETSMQDRFENEHGPDGSPWEPTVRGGSILRQSGQLVSSLTHEASPDRVEAGTNKIYAGTHQDGAVIEAKNGKSLHFTIGGKSIFAKRVVIPARPFAGINADDMSMMTAVLQDHLVGGVA